MQNLHVSPELLGATLISSRGDKRRIMAVWLEEASQPAYRPQFVALVVGPDGECFKLNLPDTDWEFQTP